MKKFLLLIFLSVLTFASYSQNKTLGVGVAVPNPNAALDVDSPTGNQGMLIPRLTSAQITALGLVLGAADKGMMIYNKETDNLIIWNGAAFGISVAATSTNANAAVLGTTTGTGAAGVFQNTNAANTSSALYGVTNGTGNAIAVRGDITNATNTSAAVYGSTVGSGVGLYGISTGTGAAIQGYTTTAPTAIFGRHDGATLGYAGLFSITNTSNAAPSLRATTISTGSAGDFQITNAANTAPAINISHAGTGNAITANRPIQATSFIGDGSLLTNVSGIAFPLTTTQSNVLPLFQVTNTGNGTAGRFVTNAAGSTEALNAEATGSSAHALRAVNSGTSGGAARFNTTNTANTSTSISVTNLGLGVGASIGINNAASTANAFMSNTNGSSGFAGSFETFGTSNPQQTLNVYHAGMGSAAYMNINNATNSNAAIGVETNGTGSVGNFNINNAANTSPAISINHAGTGNAITANRPIQATQFIGDGSLLTNLPPMSFPFTATNTTAPNGSALLKLESNPANSADVVAVAEFSNLNAAALSNVLRVNNAGTGALVLATSSGTGSGGFFNTTNAANALPALRSQTIGTGRAFQATINNASSTANAILGSTNGTGAAVFGENTGTGNGFAGLFQNTNATNTFPAIQASTVGTGPGVRVIQNATSLGKGMDVFMQNTTGTQLGFTVDQQGLGGAANFTINNPASTSAALVGTTTGTGAAIQGTTSTGFTSVYGRRDGATNGNAGLFDITNAANTFPALQTNTVGSGTALIARTTGTGGAGYFQIANATNTLPALASTTDGTGQAASFNITNASSSANGISSITNSTGAAIFSEITGGGYAALDAKVSGTTGQGVIAQIENASNSGRAIMALTNGTGSAGNFQISNATSGSAGVFSTTAGTGAAIQAETSTGFASVYGLRDGATNGHAGLFRTTNSSNNFPPLQVEAAGNSSNALYINHTGSGGNLVVFANSDVPAARIDKTGKGIFNGGTQTGGADIAEMFDVEGARESYEPGDVLVISESTDRTVEKSSTTNSTKVVGVYATKPGVTLTEKGIDENLDQLVPMGVIGVIPTKVCLENGAIKRGDLLVTSSKSGHAMKAVSAKGDGVFPAGVIIGKALENFEHGESGLIKVLVNVK